MYPTSKTILGSARTFESLGNSAKGAIFEQSKDCTMCYQISARLPATMIKDESNTDRSDTLKRRLPQSQYGETDYYDL